MRRWLGRIGGVLLTLAVLNFASFFVLCMVWGGDALNGKVADGRYYLGNKGRYTEVSEGRWRASRAHAISVIVTHSFAIFVGGPLLTYAGRAGRARTSVVSAR